MLLGPRLTDGPSQVVDVPAGPQGAAPSRTPRDGVDVLGSLEAVCSGRGLESLGERLGELRPLLAGDLAEVDNALTAIGTGETLAHKSARHLLSLRGKLLRPLCVALAARVGAGFTKSAREYAVVVELVHTATLLHDDVVDVGDLRRGAAAARVVYGNAASIFGGDWLLLEALSRVQRAGKPEVLERLIDVVKEMVVAEALQLARRGRISTSREEYFNIVQGKTASLFRWAMFAGARAGGAGLDACAALESYGGHLGVAFQVIDDVLDVVGNSDVTGKAPLADLREGKMTYPLIVAYERHRDIGPLLRDVCTSETLEIDPAVEQRVAEALRDGAVVEQCLELADLLCKDAVDGLAVLPESGAKTALESLAFATLRRRR